MRYRFVQDETGDWYLIHADKAQDFEAWVYGDVDMNYPPSEWATRVDILQEFSFTDPIKDLSC